MSAGAFDMEMSENTPMEDSSDPDLDESITKQVASVVLAQSAMSRRQADQKVIITYTEASAAFATIKEGLKDSAGVETMRSRVAVAVARANEAAAIGQTGLSRDLLDTAAGWVLEQQAASLGCGQWLERQAVLDVVRATAKDQHLETCYLHDFPRVIPTDVQAKIAMLKPVFQNFWIVFTNPKKNKVKDRDPILFGMLDQYPDRVYHIASWEDEFCDMTIDKFITLGQTTLHERWALHETPPEPSDEELAALIARVRGTELRQDSMPWWRRVLDRFTA